MARKKSTLGEALAQLTPAALPKVVPTTLQAEAKALYMRYLSHNEICATIGVSSSQLARWRKDGDWAIEREESERGLIEDAFASRRVALTKITGSVVEQLERGIAHLRSRPTPPTIQETERLSMILANLDKISRLDSNKATENIAVGVNVKMSADDIRDIIRKDPFLKQPA